MAVDDGARLQLYRRLEQVLGHDEAGTLMAQLPPNTWADLATKQDLAVLRAEVRAEIQTVRADTANQTRQLVLTLIPVIAALNGVAVALVAIAR